MNDKTQIKSLLAIKKLNQLTELSTTLKRLKTPRKQKTQLSLILEDKPRIKCVWIGTKIFT